MIFNDVRQRLTFKQIKKLIRHGLSRSVALAIVLVSLLLNPALSLPQVAAITQSAGQHSSFSPKGFPGAINTGKQFESNASTTYICGNTSYCYYYVGASQWGLSATGASVDFTQAKPTLGVNDSHSLTELAVESSDGRQIVEVGWTVARDVNGDTLPHLFVYHWVDGNSTCYNGCGFVPVATPVPAGGVVKTNTAGKFKILFKNNAWQVYYNGSRVGYFPKSLWGGTFTKAYEVQVFGEVSGSPTALPKTQMGDGLLGTRPLAAIIKNFALWGTTTLPALSPYAINVSPTAYTFAGATATSLRYGGPGY